MAASFQTRRVSDAALVTVEPLDEGRAEPAQQQARERHAHHLLLDDKGEIRRQGGRGHDAVDVACMVGDHHAGSVRQALASLDRQANARCPEEPSRGHARDQPARALRPGSEQIDHECDRPNDDEQHEQ